MNQSIRIGALAGLAAVATLLGGGCGDDGTPAPPAPREPPARLISLGVFGGYPPSLLRVRITPQGEGVAVTRGPAATGQVFSGLGPPTRGRFRVPVDELENLTDEIEEASIGELDPGEQVCSDCLIYRLSYGAERFESDMLTIPPELEKPIRRIEALAGASFGDERRAR